MLTYEKFLEVTESTRVRQSCSMIAKLANHEKQQEEKKKLPIFTWNAWFDGPRKNALAHPSGAFMLDVDGVENPSELWSHIVGRKDELGILLAHKHPISIVDSGLDHTVTACGKKVEGSFAEQRYRELDVLLDVLLRKLRQTAGNTSRYPDSRGARVILRGVNVSHAGILQYAVPVHLAYIPIHCGL